MARGKSNELKDFIDYSISKGISREQVQNMLLESGWPDEVVDRMFVKPGQEIMTSGDNALKLVNVKKSYGKNIVLDNINLGIKPGEIFGIIGLSGSGKTTLLNTLVGFVDSDEGDVVIKSANGKIDYLISKKNPKINELFGFAAQHPSFYDQLTVEENLNHFSSLYNIPKKERKPHCFELIKMVGLESARAVLGQNLSGGMQKRLDIACALVHTPHILILDEPTSDLDPVSREDMWALIKSINAKGTTIIMASHFVNELEELCDRFAILHGAKIKEVGTPDELKTSYSRNYEIMLETKSKKYEKIINSMKSKKSFQIEKAEVRNKMLTLYTLNPEQALYGLAKLIDSMGEKIVDISVNRPTIKELFESVVKK